MVAHLNNRRTKTPVTEIYFDSLKELYDVLVARQIIYTNDWDPYTRAQIERAGFDYVDFEDTYNEEYERSGVQWYEYLQNYNLPVLNDVEIYLLIDDCLHRNYIFDIFYFETDHKIEFDEDGKVVPRIKVVD